MKPSREREQLIESVLGRLGSQLRPGSASLIESTLRRTPTLDVLVWLAEFGALHIRDGRPPDVARLRTILAPPSEESRSTSALTRAFEPGELMATIVRVRKGRVRR